MTKPVVYRAVDISRWLTLGAATVRKLSAVEQAHDIKSALHGAFGAVLGQGKGAIADALRLKIATMEYRLYEDRFERSHGVPRSVLYSEIVRIEPARGCDFLIQTRSGSFQIKPYAWIAVSGARVPLGWLRDGMEVPFELLIEEIELRTPPLRLREGGAGGGSV